MEKDIGYLIKKINDKLKVKADKDLKQHDITLVQSKVLSFLNNKGGQSTQKEIEIYLEVSHPTVVGIVSRMEQKGYVTTWFDKKDKRNKMVQLTDEAKAMGKDIQKNICENEANMMASLSEEEIAEFLRILEVIYKNLG